MKAKRDEELGRAVREKYARVAKRAEGEFGYPIGRPSALGLGYRAEWLERVPSGIVDRFVGVGCPLRVRTPAPGERVLDVGCGTGLDVFIAASLVGARGRVVGLDLSADMLAVARAAAADASLGNVAFEVGSVEALPFDDGSFDVVVSNGALNLVPDKDAAYGEMHRVLAPGGTLAVADLLVTDSIPEEELAGTAAWST